MPDERKLLGQRRLGERAEAFLKNPLVKETLQKMEDRYFGEIVESKPEEVEMREKAYLKIQVLKDFQQEFTTMISNGNGAATQLEADRAKQAKQNDQA